MQAKTTTDRKTVARNTTKSGNDGSRSMPKEGKDPEGGLTAKGREYFAKKEGAHLRPGVQGPADTPEKMLRKGSFLRRNFTHPRGPMKDEKGRPTRLALSAHAWGEPVPRTMAETKKLAREGHELLEQYHAAKDGPDQKADAKKRRPKKSQASASQKTAGGR